MIPELYQTAYKKYQDEGDRLQKQYDLLGEQEAREYSRYRDELGDWQYERAWQQQQDADAYDRASEAYTRLYAIIGATGYQPSAQELEAAGMSQQQAEALRHEYLRQTGQLPVEAGGSGGGSGEYYGSGSGSGSGSGTDYGTVAQRILELQKLGFSNDEAWEYLGEEGVKRIVKPSESSSRSKVVKPGTGGSGKRVGNLK